jgi:hypothetical protein
MRIPGVPFFENTLPNLMDIKRNSWSCHAKSALIGSYVYIYMFICVRMSLIKAVEFPALEGYSEITINFICLSSN